MKTMQMLIKISLVRHEEILGSPQLAKIRIIFKNYKLTRNYICRTDFRVNKSKKNKSRLIKVNKTCTYLIATNKNSKIYRTLKHTLMQWILRWLNKLRYLNFNKILILIIAAAKITKNNKGENYFLNIVWITSTKIRVQII